jgi:hypothetical protein
METEIRRIGSPVGLPGTGRRWLAASVFTILAATYVQPAPGQEPSKDPPTASPEARPTGDPKGGVVKPPDIDPKMSKQAPDIDPAINAATPGKATPMPTEPATPEIQPR